MAFIINKMRSERVDPTFEEKYMYYSDLSNLLQNVIPPLSHQDSIVLWQPQNNEADFHRNYLVQKRLGGGGFGTAYLVIGRWGYNKDKAFVAKFNQRAAKG